MKQYKCKICGEVFEADGAEPVCPRCGQGGGALEETATTDKTAMYKLTYGLFVVTAKQNGKDNGCVTNTVGQVTSSPNQISLTVNKANYTCDMIAATGAFNVSVLSREADFALFQRFGFVSGRDKDKFADFADYARAGNGLTYLTKGVNAVLSARVTQTLDLGTHLLFIGEVTGGKTLSDVPSATYEYYQSNIKPRPAPPAETKQTVWRCKVCGYEYVGETLPEGYICPICKHGAEDFEKVG